MDLTLVSAAVIDSVARLSKDARPTVTGLTLPGVRGLSIVGCASHVMHPGNRRHALVGRWQASRNPLVRVGERLGTRRRGPASASEPATTVARPVATDPRPVAVDQVVAQAGKPGCGFSSSCTVATMASGVARNIVRDLLPGPVNLATAGGRVPGCRLAAVTRRGCRRSADNLAGNLAKTWSATFGPQTARQLAQ